ISISRYRIFQLSCCCLLFSLSFHITLSLSSFLLSHSLTPHVSLCAFCDSLSLSFIAAFLFTFYLPFLFLHLYPILFISVCFSLTLSSISASHKPAVLCPDTHTHTLSHTHTHTHTSTSMFPHSHLRCVHICLQMCYM